MLGRRRHHINFSLANPNFNELRLSIQPKNQPDPITQGGGMHRRFQSIQVKAENTSSCFPRREHDWKFQNQPVKVKRQLMQQLNPRTSIRHSVNWETREAYTFTSNREMMRSKRKTEYKLSKLKFYSNNEQVVRPPKQSGEEEEANQDGGYGATREAAEGGLKATKRKPASRSSMDEGRVSPGTRMLINTEIFNYNIINQKSKPAAAVKKRIFRRVDKDQQAQGYIDNKIPAERDGAILAIVESNDLDAGTQSRSGAAKRDRVLITMGGDRFQNAFNDTFIMGV